MRTKNLLALLALVAGAVAFARRRRAAAPSPDPVDDAVSISSRGEVTVAETSQTPL